MIITYHCHALTYVISSELSLLTMILSNQQQYFTILVFFVIKNSIFSLSDLMVHCHIVH